MQINRREAKHRKPPEYPIGTVALYGPDDKTTTKIAAGVIMHATAEAIVQRWVSTNIMNNPKVQAEIQAFFHCAACPNARDHATGESRAL
jgi:hypothetical protein